MFNGRPSFLNSSGVVILAVAMVMSAAAVGYWISLRADWSLEWQQVF